MSTLLPNTEHSTGKPRIKRSVTGVRILGSGSYVPETVLKNEDLAELGCDTEWIRQRTGILERRIAGEDQATSDLAYMAALDCLNKAGMTADDIDLILIATMTPDHFAPSTACIVQNRLGCTAPALDLNAACSGFIYGLITAAQFVKTGCYRRILLIGAETMARTVNPKDIKTVPLFGDAAGAIIVGPSEDGENTDGILSFELGSDGSQGELLLIPSGAFREPVTVERVQNGRHYLQMDGRPVFKWAVRQVAQATRNVVADAGLSLDEIDAFIFHQANIRILDAAVNDLGIDSEKVFTNLHNYGNTSAGSVPLAVDEAIKVGLIQPGSKSVLCGFGAGLTWGAVVFQW
ncbi:MAG: beta-ketoacyl-ACP synthase III [Planctomycetota bacterium]|nr:beta-ketoacyl-ACP synthase III [Planctomycetota bacterium]